MTSSSACCVTPCVTALPTVLMAVMRPTAVPSFQVQVRSASGRVLSDPSAGWTPPGLAQIQACLVILPAQNLFPMGTAKTLLLSLPGLLAKGTDPGKLMSLPLSSLQGVGGT